MSVCMIKLFVSDHLYSTSTVAKRLDVKNQTLLKWVRTGTFPSSSLRKGKSLWWLGSVLNTWIQEHSNGE